MAELRRAARHLLHSTKAEGLLASGQKKSVMRRIQLRVDRNFFFFLAEFSLCSVERSQREHVKDYSTSKIVLR